MDYILRDVKSTSIYKNIIEKNIDQVEISGLIGVFKTALISAIKSDKKRPILIVTYNEIQAKNLINDLKYFNEDVFYFPKREISIYNVDAESSDIEFERINVLNNMYNKKPYIYVTTIEAVMQNMISKKALYENIISIKNGEQVDVEDIKQRLIILGYTRKDLTESKGEFSARGNIIDIGISEKEGYRIELWGDEIDSIRKFKLDSQRSVEMTDEAIIYPITEKVLENDINTICRKIEKEYLEQVREIEEKSKFKQVSHKNNIEEDLEEIQNGNYKTKIDKYFNEFYEEQESILDYAKGYQIFFDEIDKIEKRVESIKQDTKNLISDLIEKERDVADSLENILNFNLNTNIENSLYLKEADSKVNNYKLREITFDGTDLKWIEEETKKAVKNNKKVILLAGNKESRDKVSKLIENSIKVDDLDNIILKERSSSSFNRCAIYRI